MYGAQCAHHIWLVAWLPVAVPWLFVLFLSGRSLVRLLSLWMSRTPRTSVLGALVLINRVRDEFLAR
jgi:hypothetical protein